ncbi:hypothetical protein C7E22_14605, partial [Vibrio sp. V02_P2A34T13]
TLSIKKKGCLLLVIVHLTKNQNKNKVAVHRVREIKNSRVKAGVQHKVRSSALMNIKHSRGRVLDH